MSASVRRLAEFTVIPERLSLGSGLLEPWIQLDVPFALLLSGRDKATRSAGAS